ncbi:uncharacterized protein LOC121385136 [Gigantopelta aegis]|uniref:uncharacterized protein LOC121385136 n=1 Tax=Gigantopelta aegis TaxID=1735272 RepID=UPI001B889186|nr:uncharacterized protein LOC121385136 [Gigantopelta aegis]
MASSFLGSGEDGVSCPLCRDVYEDPRTLPCGHTFCSHCLESHISASIGHDKTFRCPMCMRSIHMQDDTKAINSWATQFPLIVALTYAIDEVKRLKRRNAPAAQKRPEDNDQRREEIVKTEIPELEIVEILKPDIKSLTDCQPMTDTQTERQADRLTLADTRKDRQTLTDTQTDRQKDRLTLTDTRTHRLTWTFHTDISSDKRYPDLSSIAVLGGDRSKKIVLSDLSNSCVKCFSAKTSKLLFNFELPGPPGGLARSSDQQVVVTLPRKRQILYLHIQDDILLTNTLKTEEQYNFISVLPSNRLVVSELFGVCLDILDEGGRVIQSLPRHLIPRPSCLTVKGDSLVVVSENNSLKYVTSSGHVTWQPSDSARLRGLCGVACDLEESVYVCDVQRNCIVQLSRDGEVIGDVITDQDGLSRPEFVCCDHVKIFTWSKANRETLQTDFVFLTV